MRSLRVMDVAVSDRILPANLEAERAILGALLLHPDVFAEVGDRLDPSDFFRAAHRIIYATIVALVSRGQPADFVMVRDALARSGELDDVGGPAYIAALADGVPRSSNVGHYAQVVRERAALRRIIHVSTKAQSAAYEAQEDAHAVLDATIADLLGVAQGVVSGELQRVSRALPGVMADLDELSKPESSTRGERTGFPSLDRILVGLKPATIIVLAARPSAGKSSLALNMAVNVAKRSRPVAVFSLEMSTAELMIRLLSGEARIDSNRLMTGVLTQDEWLRLSQALETLNPLPLFIEDPAHLTVMDVRAKARRVQVEQKGLALIVVDYVQLMAAPRGQKYDNREQEVAAISRGLKQVAKDLKVPILVLSQLNRAPEARPDGRPQLGDLRSSGALEQDADVALLIYRADMYPKKQGRFPRRKTQDVVQEEVEKGVTEIIVAKHRAGATGTARLMFHPEITLFEPLAM